MTITKIGRKEDLEEESYFRKLSLCYRFPPDVTSCFAEVTLKRKIPVTRHLYFLATDQNFLFIDQGRSEQINFSAFAQFDTFTEFRY